jgi:phosphatidylserine/phosphatidylglycerophosphate/cardiolipin synthase-like enzyme
MDSGLEIMRLLFTHPVDPSLHGLPPRGSGDYLLELEHLLSGARRVSQLVCPFIDATGVDVLKAAYDRTPRTADWEIYTRKAPRGLADVAKRNGWRVYEYIGTPGGEERRGFHCKLFLADDERAILGSANLIYENLVENLELGVLLEGSVEVRPLTAVPRALKRASLRLC